ncbi:DUF3310 domain-containing protein [Mesosutterella sp. AGMB02718]|uniref:DUF3310 domain-containing protein n=1 Tax=Mesosutterella faecium TaxID=2925194 RepID=A0ABT7IPK9_9BURK|nr:DUF3310 domain-containing protein [Mesosutterella sp. AGMB02718]MDL2060327.1 DUF3310 domain-containing protein [Mesosutterella sp. AGMB02718]MDL2060550.1 DUF3310 domain-containing protein [Mesosutterella sp. AGMB02718]
MPENTEKIDHPAHYNSLPHEVISIVGYMSFAKGNAVKYLMRAPFKGAYDEDLRKAQWYLHWIDEHYAGYEPIDPQRQQMIEDNIKALGDRTELTYPLHLIALDFWHLARNSLDAAIKLREKEKENDGQE